MNIKSVLFVAALAIGFNGVSAEAAGCLKGAAVGGVAGHVAGRHAVVGAAGGCMVGRHEANKKAKADPASAASASAGTAK